MKYPTHLYPIHISPPAFDECDCPVSSVGYVSNNVLFLCKFGHLIRGYTIPQDKAKSHAERAAKKLHVEALPY